MIENRNLEVGTRLVADYKKTRYVCAVEQGEDGKTAFVLEDGKRFTSPSAAGSAVMGGTACNGWRFWTPEAEVGEPKAAATKAPRAAKKADSAPKTTKGTGRPRAKKDAAYKLIRPMESQEDVPEDQVRYWCDACMDHFLGFAGEAPEQCPNGHRADDPEFSGEATPVEVEG